MVLTALNDHNNDTVGIRTQGQSKLRHLRRHQCASPAYIPYQSIEIYTSVGRSTQCWTVRASYQYFLEDVILFKAT